MILLFVFSLSLENILSQPELEFAQVGMIVVDLEKDSVLFAYNHQKNFIPASNVKIVTSAAALTFLGPDYRFKTSVVLNGTMRMNRWDGDIIVIGGGDPGFSLGDLELCVSAVKGYGVSHVAGDIILVDDYFTDERLPVGWAWHYLDARYAAEISALSVNRNVVNVRIQATDLGELANVAIEPATRYVKLENEMRTKADKDSIIIFRRPEANTIYVDGGIGLGHKRDIEVAIKDPTMFFGEYLKERLSTSGVRVSGRCVRGKGSNAYHADPRNILIDSILSPPLYEMIRELNTESVNLYGEAMLKTLGAYYMREGSFRAGTKIVKGFMQRCGVDTSHVALYDGSGLSRHNLLSPYDIMLVLRYMYHSDMYNDFYWLLPGPGDGTLELKFNGLKGQMRGKTGTLDAVSCLSGYLNLNETDYCFSMLFNNFTCSNRRIEKIQEEILLELRRVLQERT